MPGVVADVPALLERLKGFLQDPEPVGVYVHVADVKVDVTLHVVAERVGAYAWRCGGCGALAKRGSPPRALVPTSCPHCAAEAPKNPAFRGDLLFRTYAWSVRWPVDGKPGWGLGRLVDEGRFTDASLSAGLARVENCLTRDLPTLEAQGIVSVRDLHALLRMGPTPPVEIEFTRP